MSGGVPKRVWQGRMATKTNQTGMKIQGFPSMIGRKTSNKRIISNRVNSKFVVCGSGRSGWRCKHGVDGDNAGENARKKYCEQVINGVNGISCGEQQPLSRNLAGGVGNNVSNPRLRAAQGTCGTNTVSRGGTKDVRPHVSNERRKKVLYKPSYVEPSFVDQVDKDLGMFLSDAFQ